MRWPLAVYASVGAIAGGLGVLCLQPAAHGAEVGDYICRMSWSFPAGDKGYTGEGKTQSLAEQDAHIKCAQAQALSQYKAICAGTPSTQSCNQVHAPPKPPPSSAPTPIWCVKPSSPADADRIKQLPLKSNISDSPGEGGAADPGNSTLPYINLPAGTQVTRVYCRVEDAYGEGWCADTPYNPSGCDYWAWTQPPQTGLPRAAWLQDHWRLQVSFYNQSNNRKRRFQIFAE